MRFSIFLCLILIHISGFAQKIAVAKLVSFLGTKEGKIATYLQSTGWEYEGPDTLYMQIRSDSLTEDVIWKTKVDDTTSIALNYYLDRHIQGKITAIDMDLSKTEFMLLLREIPKSGFTSNGINRGEYIIENKFIRRGLMLMLNTVITKGHNIVTNESIPTEYNYKLLLFFPPK